MVANLVAHRGARLVSYGDLDMIPAPPPTETWYPLSHSAVLGSVLAMLGQAGFRIHAMRLAVTQDNARFFGTLDLASPIVEGVSLAVGVRNSIDKSLPIGFACGSRVFVCDNLAFSSEIVIARKHTRFGEQRFNEAMCRAIDGLHQYQEVAAQRIDQLRNLALTDDRANSLILQAYEKDIIGARLLPQVIHEWREPQYEEFSDRTGWSLLNCFTEVLKDRQRSQPQRAAYETMQLQRLLVGQEDANGLQAAAA